MRSSPFEILQGNYSPERLDDVRILEIEKGAFLYRPPQRITPIFEIVAGVVKIGTYSAEGEEVCYDILKPGDFFGNLQFLNGQFSEFSKALCSVKLRVYEHSFFMKLTKEVPEFGEWFNFQLVSRWCRAEDRLFAVRSMDASEKVSRILPHFQEWVEDNRGKKVQLLKLCTYQDIADLTGLTRQTVSKVLNPKTELIKPAFSRPRARSKA